MALKSCRCNPRKLNPATDFFAKGKVHIFIVLNLGNFLEENSKRDFDRLRGGRAFADAVRTLRPDEHFAEDEEEKATADRGHEFQIFRGHLRDDWLFPTYRLRKEDAPPPDDPALATDWMDYDLRIRLSRAGFLEVKITKNISPDGENIITILKGLMEMSARGDPNTDPHSVQLKLALYCADLFLKSIPASIPVTERKAATTTEIRIKPIGIYPTSLPYRQRHMVLFFREIVCAQCWGRIGADRLWSHYSTTLAAILEGALVENPEGALEFPDMDAQSIKFHDLASWKDDLCVFAPERSLIYFPEKSIFLSGQIGTAAVRYEHYWECINRGIEHTIVVRAALQIIEYNTTRDLDEVPRLTQKVVDGDVSDDDTREISRMAQAVSNTFNTLPLLRDVLVPSSSYRASYAVSKFDLLHSVLHLKAIEEHVERNVDELVSFVQFFSSMELQDELNKSEATINRVGVVIAIVALAVAGPSFLADYREFAVVQHGLPEWTAWAFFALIALSTSGLIWWLSRQTKKRGGLTTKQTNRLRR